MLRAVKISLLSAVLIVLGVGLVAAECLVGDLDGLCNVNLEDLLLFTDQWLESREPIIEAEDYTSKTDGSGAAAGSIWMELTGEGSSGDGYMRAMPDIGRTIDTNIESESPHLGYEIDFVATGTYYLWLKGWSEDPFSQYVHYGLDGSAVSSGVSDSAKLSHDDAFTWQSQRGDGGRPTFMVDSAGQHTLDIWMREDGAKIDSLLVTSDPDYIPEDSELLADLDGSYRVDMADFAMLAENWLVEVVHECEDWQTLHPEWIFCEDFETRDVSTFTTYWTSMGNVADALTMSSDVPPQSNGVRSLQVTAKRGLNTGGKLSKVFSQTYDELYARLYVKFAYDYGYNHHFCKLGTVFGGGAGQLPVNKFWTGLEPTTKLSHYYPATYYPPPGLWHFYTYWPHMKSWQTPEGEPDGIQPNPYYGNNFAPQVPVFTPRDEWICIEYMIRANSNPADPQNSDGAQRFWINGELVGDWSPGTPIGYWYRDTFRLAPEDPRSGPFEGFRWRDEEWVKLEYFKLENYVSEGVFQKSEEYKNDHPGFIINDQEAACWFDNVVISTSYIGPIDQ